MMLDCAMPGVRWSNVMKSAGTTSSIRCSTRPKSACRRTNGSRAATALPHVLLGPAPATPARADVPEAILHCRTSPSWTSGREPAPSARIDQRREETLHAFADQLRYTEGRVLLAAESAGRRELLLELLRPYDITTRVVGNWQEFLDSSARIALTVAPLASGVTLRDPPVTIYAEEQLFGERARQERRRRRTDRDPAKIIQQLADLRPGAPVVHEDYGVGRYTGMTTMDAGGMTAEFLVLEYAEGDKLYVPVQALERISRYTGAPAESAPLHKLGGDQWTKARARAAAKIRDAAAELLDVYARRAAREGHAFQVDDQQVRAFESGFPFEETVDQLSAIQAVIEDLRSGKPMDRVVCGDVGFGKTEVALRAAFVAVQGGKQVAVLVPTTLLAQQHYETFADRFADWPVKIELLSRFRAGAQSKVALDGLASGKVDIVVGTHRLLQPGVKFKDLGLVIIDEEHRFGVRDKERLKSLRAEVDVLTLTATPIPRTLNMALGGLRDLSLITTPPAARLSIKTFVSEWSDPTVREACLRELRRGGQVYFVHNSVETIEKTAQQLAELVPEARIVIGHGQMRERDLEQVMLDFYHKRANLLLCTTIIESGIDVPTANTIIIDRADRFGLAQLHQLRGRVGRSHHQAYAYLITPPKNAMTADAARRLEAIESLEDLGAGFVLATHDLEIRGAGELLGEGQSGQIQEIGFALYMELLERAVKAMQAGKVLDLEKPLHHGPEIDLHVPVAAARSLPAGRPRATRALQAHLVSAVGDRTRRPAGRNDGSLWPAARPGEEPVPHRATARGGQSARHRADGPRRRQRLGRVRRRDAARPGLADPAAAEEQPDDALRRPEEDPRDRQVGRPGRAVRRRAEIARRTHALRAEALGLQISPRTARLPPFDRAAHTATRVASSIAVVAHPTRRLCRHRAGAHREEPAGAGARVMDRQ